MKILKSILILSLIIILSFPLISSVSIELNEQYDKGETLIAKVSGNFVDNINKENVFFYRRHMPTSVAEYDVLKIQEQFFISAKLGVGKLPDNYSIQIKNVRYMNGSQSSDETIIGNFSITSNTSDFWVYPGTQIVEQNYSLQVQNLQSETITIYINQGETSSSSNGGWFSNFFGENEANDQTESDFTIDVLSGEIKDINFELESLTILKEIKISSENTEYFVPIYNIYGGEIIENETIDESEIIEDDIIEEDIIEEEDEIIIIIDKETGEEEEITREDAKLKNCVELNGEVCLDNETCEGTETYASDFLCCLDECVLEKKSNFGKIIGWILFIVVILVLLWIFGKKKDASSSKVNLLKVGKK